MKYRELNSLADFALDVNEFIALIGEDDYHKLFDRLSRGLNQKGFVTPTDDLRFSLELQLLNLEFERIRTGGVWSGIPQNVHEGADLLIGIGQTIRSLSDGARKVLRGQIIGGLKTNGLRALQHEMRVAGMLSQVANDFAFADLENGGGADFIASTEQGEFEVEAKAIPIYSGTPIPPQDADKFLVELRKHFRKGTGRQHIPIVNIDLAGPLDIHRPNLVELVKMCNQAIESNDMLVLSDYAAVSVSGSLPMDVPPEKLLLAAQLDAIHTGAIVATSTADPKAIIRLTSKRPSHFARNLLRTIHDAASRQLTGSRPGVVWVHIDYVPMERFDTLRSGEKPSFFDRVANFAFKSEVNLSQLVISGGAFFANNGTVGRTSFRRVVYNAPDPKFPNHFLFEGGKVRSRRTSDD